MQEAPLTQSLAEFLTLTTLEQQQLQLLLSLPRENLIRRLQTLIQQDDALVIRFAEYNTGFAEFCNDPELNPAWLECIAKINPQYRLISQQFMTPFNLLRGFHFYLRSTFLSAHDKALEWEYLEKAFSYSSFHAADCISNYLIDAVDTDQEVGLAQLSLWANHLARMVDIHLTPACILCVFIHSYIAVHAPTSDGLSLAYKYLCLAERLVEQSEAEIANAYFGQSLAQRFPNTNWEQEKSSYIQRIGLAQARLVITQVSQWMQRFHTLQETQVHSPPGRVLH